MDTTSPVTHISLCAGYGGIDLGLKRAVPDLRTVAFSEIEAFACANLVAKMEAGLMDPAPVWTDLKTFPWAEFRGRVDILTGGYPCQPFSAAGKRLGTKDPRHLWPYIASGIRILKPRVCFFENVEGHISLGLREVVRELEELGYETTWGVFSAAECGAPHQRKRVFILAHRKGKGLERYSRLLAGCSQSRWIAQGSAGSTDGSGDGGNVWPSRPGEPQHAWEPPRVVGNASESRLPFSGGQSGPLGQPRAYSESERSDESLGNAESGQDNGREPRDLGLETSQWGCSNDAVDGAGEGLGDTEILRAQGQWAEQQTAGLVQSSCSRAVGNESNWQTQSTLGRDTHGTIGGLDYAELHSTCDNRTDELRLLGNGVVPATAAKAFTTLWNQLTPTHPSRLTTPSR